MAGREETVAHIFNDVVFDGGKDEDPFGNVNQDGVEDSHHPQDVSKVKGKQHHLEKVLNSCWEWIECDPGRRNEGQIDKHHKQVFSIFRQSQQTKE